ncbi:MAG: potassium transporter, partial [gamma proteobacterium symbiont of Ctena orbiculata]
IKEAPEQIQTLRAGINQGHEEDDGLDRFIQSSGLAALEVRISQEELNLTQARDDQKSQLEELSTLFAGSKQIGSEISASSESMAKIRSEIEGLPQNELKQIRQARLMSLQAREAMPQAELAMLTLRLGNQSLLTNLTQAKRDATAVRISRLQANLKQLNQAAAEIRETEAKQARQAAEQLEQETVTLPLPLQIIAQENAKTRSELEQLVYWEKRVQQQLTSTKRKLVQIQTDFGHSRQRVEVVGGSEAIGKMLSRRRAALPSLRSYSRSSAERKYEINKATDRQIEIEELLLQRGNLTQHVETITRSLLEGLSDQEAQRLNKQAFSLAGARREALNELQEAYGRYIGQLTALDLSERQLLDLSESYIDYIDDQLIWISSGGLRNIFDPAQLLASLGWLVSPQHWRELGADLVSASRHNVHTAFIVLLLFLFVVWKQPFARLQIPVRARS